EPGPGESVGAVVGSLGEASAALHERWRGLSEVQWETVLSEPELGEVSLTTLCFMRLTEVEVHSVDLDLGLGPWSDEFVEAAFAVRVLALPRLRRRPDADRRVCGSWLLSDGVESWYVEAEGATATVERSAPLDEVISIIEGDRRALVGMLLGRVPVDTLELTGNIDLAKAFKAAFPGP
ncbi:MAG TPA: hypothetical protein VGZ52_13025, partial [Acidimicrobiales bacterium]|nr:hypothetical protein [Acidimicrobiales bacterium]